MAGIAGLSSVGLFTSLKDQATEKQLIALKNMKQMVSC